MLELIRRQWKVIQHVREKFISRACETIIDEQQLAKAPRRLCDRTIVADITTYVDQNAADLVVCNMTQDFLA